MSYVVYTSSSYLDMLYVLLVKLTHQHTFLYAEKSKKGSRTKDEKKAKKAKVVEKTQKVQVKVMCPRELHQGALSLEVVGNAKLYVIFCFCMMWDCLLYLKTDYVVCSIWICNFVEFSFEARAPWPCVHL